MPFNRMSIDGTLGGGVEDFSCTLGFATDGGFGIEDPSALSEWANDALTAWGGSVGWEATLRGMLGSNASIRRIRVYYYPSFSGPAASQGVSTGGAVAGSGSITMPPQCSVVASLLTGFPGRRFRGRIYWPNLTSTVGASLTRTGNPSNASLPAAFASMLRAMADAAAPAEVNPVVVSRAGSGALTPVSTVSVGDVIDTQRRRRDRLVETRLTAAVPA